MNSRNGEFDNKHLQLSGIAGAHAVRSALATICVFCFVICASASQLLEVCANPTVSGPEILLKDIVKNPSLLPTGWAERTLMQSPEPGKFNEHSLISIAFALQQYPDMKEVLLHGQNTLTIKRAGADLDCEKIIHAVEHFIQKNEKWKDIKIRIRCEPLKEKVNISSGNVKIKVKDCTAQREPNRYLFETAVIVDGVTEQVLPVYAKVIPMQEIWVAKQPLKRGHSPNAEDLKTKLVPVDSSMAYIPVSESIKGLELTRPIRENQPLNRRFLVQPLCVQRGDSINVMAKSGALTVTMRAKALDSGRKGDHILCLNERSKRRLRVRLTGLKKAIIDF